jgi:hypothetical protein
VEFKTTSYERKYQGTAVATPQEVDLHDPLIKSLTPKVAKVALPNKLHI